MWARVTQFRVRANFWVSMLSVRLRAKVSLVPRPKEKEKGPGFSR